MTTTRLKTIHKILKETYGNGAMVQALAAYIDSHWDSMEAEAESTGRSVEHYLTLTIWNWFSGGDTAEATAKKILEQV